MNLAQIISVIKAGSTALGNQVAGAAEFLVAEKNTFTHNSGYVVPIEDLAGENMRDSGVDQIITERFGVIVGLDSRPDKRGQAGIIDVYSLRTQLFSCLINYLPTGAVSPIIYAGGTLVDLNRAYIWYQYAFSYQMRIDESDGVNLDSTDDFLRLAGQGGALPGTIPLYGSPDGGDLDIAEDEVVLAWQTGFSAGMDRGGFS